MAAWTLAVILLEIALAMPLLATVTSVGMVDAPPLPPARPSSWASNAAAAPSGAGAGPDTVTPNPGRVIVCETPFTPVMVTPLP